MKHARSNRRMRKAMRKGNLAQQCYYGIEHTQRFCDYIAATCYKQPFTYYFKEQA